MYSPQSSASPEASDTIFQLLISPRFTDKYAAVDRLNDASIKIDRPRLCTSILNALKTDYSVETEQSYDDKSIGETRSWLLSALGRVADNNNEVTDEVAKHIDPESEPYTWARYWALEGLVAGNNIKTLEIADKASKGEQDPLTKYLALAFLASKGNRAALAEIKDDFAKGQRRWEILRALRIVPLRFAGQTLCGIVENAEYSDETYDAILALGRLTNESLQPVPAAQALSSAIATMRGKPWHDGMRSAAITALGNLKVESSGPLLVEELTDYNPSIVREAARSITRILGLPAAVSRVVEAAVKSGAPDTVSAFARALSWMDRDTVVEELVDLMGSGSVAQQDMARLLLSELGGTAAYEKLRALTAATKQYREILERAEDRVQDLFEQTVHEAQRGFHLATWMDLVVFGLGILLLVASATTALSKTGDIAVWVGLGGAGVLGVLYSLLVSNPRRQVREAVDHLMRVKIIFLAYLRRLHQTDQAYTRLVLTGDRVTAEQLKEYSDVIGTIMEGTAKQLGEVVPPPKANPSTATRT
jgi:HEAT repeat protein